MIRIGLILFLHADIFEILFAWFLQFCPTSQFCNIWKNDWNPKTWFIYIVYFTESILSLLYTPNPFYFHQTFSTWFLQKNVYLSLCWVEICVLIEKDEMQGSNNADSRMHIYDNFLVVFSFPSCRTNIIWDTCAWCRVLLNLSSLQRNKTLWIISLL